MQKTEFARMLNFGLGLVAVQKELRESEVNDQLSKFFTEANCPYSEHTINGWRKGGHRPDATDKVAALVVHFCKTHDRYDMVSPIWAKRILKLANHPKPDSILKELFNSINTEHEVSVTLERRDTTNERLLEFMSDSMHKDLHKTFKTVEKQLQAKSVAQSQTYFPHVGRLLEYLHHFISLLPTKQGLTERERSVLVTAAYLFRLSRYLLYQLESEHTADLLMYESESRETSAKTKLGYDQFVEWIQKFLQEDEYKSLQWTNHEFAVQIATVCQGALQHELYESNSYSASGNGEYLVRPALLSALLSIADMLASAKSKPTLTVLKQLAGNDAKRQITAWLRFYLQDIKIQDGHIRYHYLLPPREEYIAIQVLLSLPLQLRLRSMRDILTKHHLMLFADSTVEQADRESMPPELLQTAQSIAHAWINKLVPTILGSTDGFPSPQATYPYSGLSKLPVWRWSGQATAERYQCQLYHVDSAQRVATWETTALESPVVADQIAPNEKYEWLVYAYTGKQRGSEQKAGVFWLNQPTLPICFSSDPQSIMSQDPIDRQLMQARLHKNNEFYMEACQLYIDVIAIGNAHQQLQAQQELMLLYEEIAQQLSHYKRFRRADLYRVAATVMAQQLNRMVSENRKDIL